MLTVLAVLFVLAACGNSQGMHSAMQGGMANMMPTPNLEAPVAAESNGISIRDPWARIGTKSDNSAAYLVINNAGAADTLTSVSGSIAQAIELHTVVDDNGTMKMIPVDGGIPVEANGTQVLKPGSYHIMLIGLQKDLSTGDTFDLTLTFAKAGTLDVTVEVR